MKRKVSLLCIFVGLILMILGIVINYNSSLEKEEPSTPKEEVKIERESLDINGDLTQGLYYMTKSSWSRDNNIAGLYHYKFDKVLVSDFELVHLYEIVFERLNRKGLISNESVSEELVKKEFEEIFGDNVQYLNINNFNVGCNLVNYDINTKTYKILYTNCLVSTSVEGKVISSYKEQNKVFIEEKVLFYKDGEKYYDPEFINSTNSMIDEEDEKMLIYKYTFVYDNDTEGYHYYSIEKVNK